MQMTAKMIISGALAATIIAGTAVGLGISSGNPNALPEYNGVYARYTDGTLIKLHELPVSATAWIDLKAGQSVNFGVLAKAKSHLRNYVTAKPPLALDIDRVNAFIVKGGERKQNGFPKWLIGHYSSTAPLEGKPFELRGNGTKENMFIATVACGTSDGMLYKEEEPATFVFVFPVDENSDYKFCDLTKDKAAYRSDDLWYPKAQTVDFYGIWHDGMLHAFSVN